MATKTAAAANAKLAEGAAQLTDSADQMAVSAGVVEDSAVQLTDSADRRTELASNRTLLAAERTYAAWVRTGLTALASGVGARALLSGLIPFWLVAATGTVLIGFSGFCFVAAVWREVYPGAAPPKPDARRLPKALFLVVNAFLVLVAAAALIGVWTAPARV